MTSTWQPIGHSGPGSVTHLLDLSADDDTSNVLAATLAGIHISADNGKSWTTSGFGKVGPYIRDVSVLDGNSIAVSAPTGISCSRDRGETWGIAQTPWSPGALTFVDSNTLLCSSSESGDLYSVAIDSGQSAKIAALPEPAVQLISTGGRIYAANSNVLCSVDGGRTWSEIAIPTHDPVEDIVSAVDSTVYVLLSNSIWKVTGSSATEIPLVPVPDQLACFACSRNGHMIAIGYEDGIALSTDEGEHWNTCKLDGIPVSLLVKNHGEDMFVGLEGGGLAASLDHGENWAYVPLANSAVVTDIKPAASGLRFTLAEGIVRGSGTYEGAKAAGSRTDLEVSPLPPFPVENVHDSATNLKEDAEAVATISNTGFCEVWLHQSGYEWRRIIAHPEPARTVSLSIIDGPRTLFAGIGDSVYRPSRVGALLYTREIVETTQHPQVISIGSIATESGAAILVALTSSGFYRSHDEGMSWEPFTAPDGPPVTTFVIDPADTTPSIIAAQLGGSIWCLPVFPESQ